MRCRLASSVLVAGSYSSIEVGVGLAAQAVELAVRRRRSSGGAAAPATAPPASSCWWPGRRSAGWAASPPVSWDSRPARRPSRPAPRPPSRNSARAASPACRSHRAPDRCPWPPHPIHRLPALPPVPPLLGVPAGCSSPPHPSPTASIKTEGRPKRRNRRMSDSDQRPARRKSYPAYIPRTTNVEPFNQPDHTLPTPPEG